MSTAKCGNCDHSVEVEDSAEGVESVRGNQWQGTGDGAKATPKVF